MTHGSALRPSLGQIANDLEQASADNLDAYHATGSAGIASERCDPDEGGCGRPLVVSAFTTWAASPRATDVRVIYYTCECRHG